MKLVSGFMTLCLQTRMLIGFLVTRTGSSLRWVLLGVLLPATGIADSASAQCEIEFDAPEAEIQRLPCTFSQRQGYVSIVVADTDAYTLSPVGDAPGNYLDADSRPVYRQAGLGSAGLIFRFPDRVIRVMWLVESE
jgi:hypothetical protein